MRRLRGTIWDPFGRTPARRLDRDLVGWYEQTLERLRPFLVVHRIEAAATIAGLAAGVRGYEQIRAANAWQAVAQAERALADLDEKDEASPA
jgi:indolepyruvate ferredoxin oxidoreductase